MTERLRDIVATDDPALAELARLVRATGDPEPRPGAQDRVRRALAELPRARPRRRWQTAVVAALVLFIVLPAAIAGVHWIVASPAPPKAPAPVPSPAAPGSPSVARRSAAAGPVPPALEEAGATAAVPAAPRARTGPTRDGEVARRAPAAVDPAASAGSGASGPRPAPEAPAPEAPAPPTAIPGPVLLAPPPASERRPHLPGPATGRAGDVPAAGRLDARALGSSHPRSEPGAAPTAADTGLVLDAMRRLRRGHDPRAALREIDAYLARFPDGDLAEEALALAIEARGALGDPVACALAEQYLQRYPHGRFRDPAGRALLQLRDPDLQRCPPVAAPPAR